MAYTEFYCQTTGSNLNAGSTTANAASLTYASGTWVAATGVFTVASGNPSSDGVTVGDFASVYPDGSSVGVFVGRVTARDATTITVSLTAKSGTAPTDGTSNRTLKLGGAWKGPNAAEAFPFGFVAAAMTNSSSNPPRVNLKAGTNYAITAAMTHSITGPIYWQGYTSAAGDGGKFTIDGGTSGASYALLTLSGNGNQIADFICQNNGATGSADGLKLSGVSCRAFRGVVHDVRGIGLDTNGGVTDAEQIETYACNQSNTAGLGGFSNNASTTHTRCISHDQSGSNNSGFVATGTGQMHSYVECIADTCGLYGFSVSCRNAVVRLHRCEMYNNANDGVRIALGSSAGGVVVIEDCNLVKNGTGGTGYGINDQSSVGHIAIIKNCGFGTGTQANTSGTVNNLAAYGTEDGSFNYASNVTPWTDPANGDFRPAIADAKGTGSGSFTQTAASYAGTVGYPDRAAAQHQDAGGGGGLFTNSFGGGLL